MAPVGDWFWQACKQSSSFGPQGSMQAEYALHGASSKHAVYSAAHAVFAAHLMQPPPKLPHVASVAQFDGLPPPAPPPPAPVPLAATAVVPAGPDPVCAEEDPTVPTEVDSLPPDPGGIDGPPSTPHAVPTAPAAISKKSKSSSLILRR